MEKELRILMIEDVPADAELEIRELKRAGLRVTHRVVETEAAYREALREFRPDLIVSDFSMPHFDGMAALALVRELAPDVPFIFVSGTIGEEYAIRALKNGATDYVLKNNLVRLPSAVERALQEQAERAARRRAEEEIKHQRAFLRQVIDLDRNRIFAKDRDGRFILANQAVADAYGCSVDDILGKTSADLASDLEQAERFWKIDLEVMDSLREVLIPEQQMTDAAGKVRWFQVIKRPLVSGDGKADMVLAVGTDITERKLQELRISRLNRTLSVLSGINSAIVRIRDRQKLFEEACRIAVERGNFGMVWVSEFDPVTLDVTPVAYGGTDAGEFASSKSTARADVPLGQGVVGRAIRAKDLVFVNDLPADPDVGSAKRREAIRRGYRSVIALPLLVEGAVFGTLTLYAKEPDFFDEEELKLLRELADDISFALDNMARQGKLEKLSRIRAVSSEINAAIVRIRERKALLEETCRIAAEHGKFELVWVALIDEEIKEINPVAWTGFSPEAAHAVTWATIAAARGTLGEAIQTRKLSVRNDIEQQSAGGRLRQEALQKGCRSNVCLPLLVDDRVVALLALFATGLGFFDADEIALLEEVAADVSFALDHIEKGEKLDYLAYYDTLTGLPNRTLFNDRLDQRIGAARDEKQLFSLMMLDIERFRFINDTLGRQAGDDLLRQISRRLKDALQKTDLLAHIGGDHFAIATHRAEEPGAGVHIILEQVLTALSGELFSVGGNDLRLAVRAGIAVYPADGHDVERLYRNAEAALKDAKRTGQRYQFYAPEMNARVAEQLKLENDLRDALLQEQYVLHYQPRFDLSSGRVVGLEALIRWRHPDRGMVSPADFIPLLEETGMILEVGRWALTRAAMDHDKWRAAGRNAPRIAVNVSPVQLRRKDFVDHVQDALAAVDKAADRIDIEITESMLMEDVEGSIEKLKTVQSMGLNIAVDDFGTGYSSLSYLARLPINSLKIDRSFITQMSKGPEQMAIISTVISLGRALNLKVVAEGVETEEQANLLRLLRCDEAQGYLFAKPMPPKEIEGLLPKA